MQSEAGSRQAKALTPPGEGVPIEARRPKPRLQYVSEYAGQPIVTDPTREAVERENSFYFHDGAQEVQFQVMSAPLMRALLDAEGVTKKEGGIELTSGKVTAVMGSFPISMLSIKKARRGNSYGRIVSDAIRGRGASSKAIPDPPGASPGKNRRSKPLISGEGGAQ